MPRKNTKKTEKEKQLLMLKSSYQMHMKTREEAQLRGKDKGVEKIDIVLKNIIAQMMEIDEDFARKCVEDCQPKKKANIMESINGIEDTASIFDEIRNMEGDRLSKLSDDTEGGNMLYDIINNENEKGGEADNNDEFDLYKMADMINDSFSQAPQQVETNSPQQQQPVHSNTNPNAVYDLIPLPSKGECYRTKIDRVPVGYLTAADENLITSPNLYESGQITNILLSRKIMNKEIDVDNLIAGDVDAIMVFLRGTSYGTDFPIVATEPNTGRKIETTVDLGKLKYKPFTLKGDENGYFDYKLPLSGANIKFKFLTKKEERLLQKLNQKENKNVASFELNEAIDKIKNALQADIALSDGDKNQIIGASEKLQKWADALQSNSNGVPYTRTVTNTMEMQIVSVNGNMDKRFIHDFVMNMTASDSLAFRRYVYDNQPGVDFEVEVERPESMGGGSFKCFLEWDDYVFWHIA